MHVHRKGTNLLKRRLLFSLLINMLSRGMFIEKKLEDYYLKEREKKKKKKKKREKSLDYFCTTRNLEYYPCYLLVE